jgi:hypothetical protein
MAQCKDHGCLVFGCIHAVLRIDRPPGFCGGSPWGESLRKLVFCCMSMHQDGFATCQVDWSVSLQTAAPTSRCLEASSRLRA